MYFICFIVGVIFNAICDLVVEPTRRQWRKECNFDCSKCKVWDCSRKRCLNYKKKLMKEGEDNDY